MAVAQQETRSTLEKAWIAMDAVAVVFIALGNTQFILDPVLGIFSRGVFRTWKEKLKGVENDRLE